MTTFDTTQIYKSAGNLSSLIRELSQQKNMAESEISDLEQQYNIILHRIERTDCLHKERSRLATQIALIQRKRRVLKDWLKVNEPYFNYIGSFDGDKVQKMLCNLVSIGRKVNDKGSNLRLRDEIDKGKNNIA